MKSTKSDTAGGRTRTPNDRKRQVKTGRASPSTGSAHRDGADDEAGDTEEIIKTTSRIPDRDQMFGRDQRIYPQNESSVDDAWPGDIEEQPEGTRSMNIDAVDELVRVSKGTIDDRHELSMIPPAGPAVPDKDSPVDMQARRTLSQRRELAEESELAGRPAELKAIAASLQGRREDLIRVIVDAERVVQSQITPDESGESQIDYNHPADAMNGDPDYEKMINLIARQRAELTLVDQALSRIQVGDYGICDNCCEEIPVRRLEAIPYTKYCIECETMLERERQTPAVRPPAHPGTS